MWLHGFGFPRYRGGLFFWADSIGVRDVYNQIAAWHQQYGERWAPSRLLRELADPARRSVKPRPRTSCQTGETACPQYRRPERSPGRRFPRHVRQSIEANYPPEIRNPPQRLH